METPKQIFCPIRDGYCSNKCIFHNNQTECEIKAAIERIASALENLCYVVETR